MTKRAVLLGVFALLLHGCDEGPIGPVEPITELPRELNTAEVEIVRAGNAFAKDLLGRVHSAEPEATAFLSPLSAAMALGMTMNGAAGRTRTQMHDMLGFGGLTPQQANESFRDLVTLLQGLDPTVEVGVANAAFHRDDFSVEPAFVQTLQEYFDAQVQGLDFAAPSATETMNAWASRHTNDRIPKVIEPPLDPQLMLVLMNAVYFNGTWTTEFDPDDSYDGPFTGPAGTETVRFMTKEDSLGYRAAETWEAVEIPYGGGAWTMVLALPLGNYALADVIDDMGHLLDPEAQWGPANIDLHMPRFELEWERRLEDDLKALGMTDAFAPGTADFSGINPNVDLFVHFVKQNTFLRVDEVGTEAAAVTQVGVGAVCACGPPTFRADRPFFVAIRERLSGTVAFAGVIVEPPVG